MLVATGEGSIYLGCLQWLGGGSGDIGLGSFSHWLEDQEIPSLVHLLILNWWLTALGVGSRDTDPGMFSATARRTVGLVVFLP